MRQPGRAIVEVERLGDALRMLRVLFLSVCFCLGVSISWHVTDVVDMQTQIDELKARQCSDPDTEVTR